VHWEEVQRWARGRRDGQPKFLAGDVLKRVEQEGDLFEPVLNQKQRLPVDVTVGAR
jgi:hypothetical protein